MQITFFGLVVVLAGLLARGNKATYFQVGFCLLGSTAAIALTALNNAPIQPSILFLPFFVYHAWRAAGAGALSKVSKAGFWLALYTVWAVLSALILPRLFLGEIEVCLLDRSATAGGSPLAPVRPVSGNMTQSAYIMAGTVAFFAFRAVAGRAQGRESLCKAVLLLAALNCFAGLLNIVEFYAGLPSVLELVRNAGYAVFGAYEVAGLVRIQGTFSEASTFAGFTLPLFAFTSTLWLERRHTRVAGLTALASLTLLLISTSATAYASMAIYAAIFGVGLLMKNNRGGVLPLPTLLWIGTATVLAVLAFAVTFQLPAITRVSEYFTHTLFNKLESSSGIERSFWNAQAWSNFLDTYGLGVGLGTVYASSYPLVILSNVGIIGAGLFVAFVLALLRGPADAIQSAGRYAVLSTLVTASVSGTVPSFNLVFYAFAAVAMAAGPVLAKSEQRGPVFGPRTKSVPQAHSFVR